MTTPHQRARAVVDKVWDKYDGPYKPDLIDAIAAALLESEHALAAKDGELDQLHKESLADRKLIPVLQAELQKQTSYAAALQREVEAAKADFEKQKTMTRLEAKANYNAIDEIHLLEAQRDRAEADAAAMRNFLDFVAHAEWKEFTLRAKATAILDQPHPGTALLDELATLRELVGKLPKYASGDFVVVDRHEHGLGWCVELKLAEYPANHTVFVGLQQTVADALAALLAWRQKEQP